jgi:hypothetical protein
LLAHSALSAQGFPFGARQKPAKQVLLAQSLFAVQSLPVAFRQVPSPSHAVAGSMQVMGSPSPARTLAHLPSDPATLQAWQVPGQAASAQQTLSTHALPAHSMPLAQVSPSHFPQLPPQSIAVSVPFIRPSEQLMQACVGRSQVGFVPRPLQSLFFVHWKHAPAPSHMPFGHGIPLATGIFVGTPPTQSSWVQAFMSSAGVSFGSTSIVAFPSAPHTLFMQSFGTWVIAGSPLVSLGTQTLPTQIDAVQPSLVGIPQSTSPTHGVQPVPQLPVLPLAVVLVLALVLVVLELVAPPPPPAEAPTRSSVQPLGASITTPASARLTPSARDPRPYR